MQPVFENRQLISSLWCVLPVARQADGGVRPAQDSRSVSCTYAAYQTRARHEQLSVAALSWPY